MSPLAAPTALALVLALAVLVALALEPSARRLRALFAALLGTVLAALPARLVPRGLRARERATLERTALAAAALVVALAWLRRSHDGALVSLSGSDPAPHLARLEAPLSAALGALPRALREAAGLVAGALPLAAGAGLFVARRAHALAARAGSDAASGTSERARPGGPWLLATAAVLAATAAAVVPLSEPGASGLSPLPALADHIWSRTLAPFDADRDALASVPLVALSAFALRAHRAGARRERAVLAVLLALQALSALASGEAWLTTVAVSLALGALALRTAARGIAGESALRA